MNIEFIGAPGAGKSTICTAVVERLRAIDDKKYFSASDAFRLVSMQKMDGLYRYPLRWLPKQMSAKLSRYLGNRSLMQYEAQNRYLASFGSSLQSYLSSPFYQKMSIDDRCSVIGHFMESASTRECISAFFPKHQTVIFDESLLQKTFMFVDHGSDESDTSSLHRYLEGIPESDLAIFVDAEVNTCQQRMLERPRGLPERLKRADSEAITQFIGKSRQHVSAVKSWMQKNSRAQIIEIMSDQSVGSSADKICTEILNIKG